MQETESDITYVMLAEIMLIFAFCFLLLMVFRLPNISDTSSELPPHLKITTKSLKEVFSEIPPKEKLPEVWTELEFVRRMKKITELIERQENQLAINIKNESRKNENEKLNRKFQNELKKNKFLKNENKKLKKKLQKAQSNLKKLWDTAHGVRPCWTVNKDTFSQKIEYPLIVELYDNYVIFRKNWHQDRSDDALKLGLNKIIDKKLSHSEFTNFGKYILDISKKGGEGTDWVNLNTECRFFIKVRSRTNLNTSINLLERYFYKQLIN